MKLTAVCTYVPHLALPTEICPVMYNYITTDTSSFLSDPNHVEVVITMCKQVCVHITAIILLPMAIVLNFK